MINKFESGMSIVCKCYIVVQILVMENLNFCRQEKNDVKLESDVARFWNDRNSSTSKCFY